MAAMLASSRAIAQAAVLGTAPGLAEPGLVRVAVLELAAESLAIGQAAARARVIVRAEAPVLAIVPAEVSVLAIVLAGVQEPEAALVEGAPERGPVAVPLRIKSVIALHHRGRVPLLAAVEDLAAVAEIMRAQAAAEAVTAWEAAAVTAVAAVLQ